MTKASFYQYVFVCAVLLFAVAARAQTLPAGQVVKFGIDGDLYSGTRQNGTFMAAGSHDWFKKAGGTGLGLIDTAGAATYRSQLLSGANLAFSRRMQFLRYSVQDSVVMMDACYARDYMGSDKTSFSGNGTKNTTSPMAWGTSPNGGAVSDKTDILDSYVSMRRNGTTLTGNVGNLVATMALSTLSTNGDRYADFEFYRERIDYNTTTGVFTNSGPAAYGGHSLWEFNADGSIKAWGDMTISFTFNSSTVSNIKVYIWVSQATQQTVNPQGFDFVSNDYNGSTSTTGYGYAAVQPNGGGQLAAWGAVNTASTDGPLWGSNSKDLGSNSNNYFSDLYSVGQFAEAAVDLTSLGIDPASFMNMSACNPPFTRFMTKSRSSSSFSAALSDFNGPFEFLDVPSVSAAIAPPAILTCAAPAVSLSGANYTAGAYYSWTAATGSIAGSNADSSVITVDKPGKYYLTAAITSGCASNVDSVVVLQDKGKPKATAAVAGMLFAGQTVQLYGGDTVLSNYMTPFGRSQGLKWEWTGPFGFYATWQNPITSSPGFHTLVVTEKRNGCKDTATVYVVPYPILPVRFTGIALRTMGAVNRLAWSVGDATSARQFVVESSGDGLQFSPIATLLSTAKRDYSFTDSASQRRLFYRVQAVNFGGAHSYSTVVRAGTEETAAATSVYRSGASVIIQYTAAREETVAVTLLNGGGQPVWNGRFSGRQGNNQWVMSPNANLAQGIYVVVLQGEGRPLSTKLFW